MNFKEKLKTIGKIFLLTIGVQIIVGGSIASVAYWGYKLEHLSIISMLLAIAGSIALLFLYLCAAVMIDNYMPSVFGLFGSFKGGFTGGEGGTEVFIRKGRTSTLTGETQYHVETRKAPGGGVFIIAAIKALFFCAFAPIRFVVESIVVLLSNDRQYAWDNSFDSFKGAMNWEDMKVPAISLSVILVSWLVIAPNLFIVNDKYNADDIEITLNGISDMEYDYSRGIEFTVDLSIRNNAKAPIEHISTYIYLKNKNGDIVYKGSGTLKAVFCDPDYDFFDEEGKYLVGDKEWICGWKISIDADEWDITEFIDADPSGLNLYYDLREVRYEEDRFTDYEAEEKAVKIEMTGNG